MSALPAPPALRRVPMTLADVPAVLALEQAVYPFAWTRGNFIDSLAAGHVAELLRDGQGALAAYSVSLPGVGEMHLLNLTVAPDWRRRGLARTLLDALVARCRAEGRARLWLEVRRSNLRAQAVYARYGFVTIGERRGYYPAVHGREDAVVMRLELEPADDAALD
jgi:[ribosomal protein S18]-alanine N-acetyltransferase